MNRRPLRTSLTFLLVALIVMTCIVVGVLTTVTVKSFLTSHLDQQLTMAGFRYAVTLEHPTGASSKPETATVGQTVGTLGARLIDGQITAIGVVAGPGDRVTVSSADRQVISDLPVGAGPQTVSLPDLGIYRIEATDGRDGDVLVTGLPEQDVRATIRFLVLIMVAVFVVVVVVMGTIGAVAVRRSLRPLHRVAANVLQVSEDPLGNAKLALEHGLPAGTDSRTEVGEVATAVNVLLARLQDAITERQRGEERIKKFVADASHELRTPLAVVRSHVELIERSAESIPDSVLDSVANIEVGTRRMTRLVDDLLLLARLDSGVPLERRDVDLTRVVLDAVSDARRAGRAHHWTLDVPEEPVIVRGDEFRLHQVVINLLTNARIHTPPGVSISTVLRVGSPSVVELIVADDGPGIPGELLPMIGRRFVRGPGPNRQVSGGTGLGLSIVIGIVAAHQGEFTIRSRPGQTVATVTLPGPLDGAG